MYNREELYRTLYESTDRSGVLTKTCQELATEIGITYQQLSVIMAEWVKMGRARKFRWDFQLFDPDKFDWTSKDYKKTRRTAIKATPTRRVKKIPTRSLTARKDETIVN